MDQTKLDRLRYLCTVPTHSPDSLKELQELTDELIFENEAAHSDLKLYANCSDDCYMCKHEVDEHWEGCEYEGCWEWRGPVPGVNCERRTKG